MKKILLIVGVLILIYCLGPTPDKPVYTSNLPLVPDSAQTLERYIANREAQHKVKPDNEAKIWWYNSTKMKTKIALLYLHGFSASRHEGFPTHINFAEKYGCNAYFARIADHGIDTTDAMLNFTADRAWESAKEGYAIAKKLGDEVVIMSTSTGGTLALKLAATYPEIKGLINFSPNIEINDPAAFLLNDPWGLQIARLVFHGDIRTVEGDSIYKKYWYTSYRLESTVQLEEMVETMATPNVFEKVTCPVFDGVYFRDEEHQDPVVRVSAVRKMHAELGTTDRLKVYQEFPKAGTHVIASDIKSGAVYEVFEAISLFAEANLGMKPASRN